MTRTTSTDPAITALVVLGAAVQALALLLRPVLAHAIAAALLLAGWRPLDQQQPAPAPVAVKPAAAATSPRRRPRKAAAVAVA